MKTIKYLYILTLGLIISCSQELETLPLTSLSDKTVWNSESNAMLALTGCYRGNIPYNATGFETDWCSYSGLIFLEFASDNALDRRATTTGNSTLHKLSDGTLNTSNSSILNYWSNSYSKIAKCNIFIENIDKVNALQAVKDRMKSEARFMRAIQYFYLSQYFQDVPLVINSLSKEDANQVKKANKTEITKFIVDELTECIALLPRHKEIKSTERGRASKQAALAFLGRTYIGIKDFPNAATTFKQIIDLGDNIIDPNYQTIFFPSNQNSNENIFATQYLENLAGNALTQHAWPAVVGGWHLVCPLGSLFESYEFTDGTPFTYSSPLYDPKDLGKNRDPRMGYTLLWDQSTFKGKKYVCHPDSVKSVDQLGAGKQATYTGFGLRKFFDESYSGSLFYYGANANVIRYAEVLLSYLEAVLEAGQPLDQPLLDATINKVRGRASVNMPRVTETDRAKLRDILRRERRVELALEGQRYWDLLRWGTAQDLLKADFYGAPFPGAKNMRKKNGATDPNSRWYVITRNFRNPDDYKWPIPQSEQDINPNLR
ncbi:MAG: RagB/SusD family nutrient uptake outer membrane protein [Mariniphaga sp.]|nr:RagB/SusD family nutrient uptake outer membrane protein [Mariniphaga sp.]